MPAGRGEAGALQLDQALHLALVEFMGAAIAGGEIDDLGVIIERLHLEPGRLQVVAAGQRPMVFQQDGVVSFEIGRNRR